MDEGATHTATIVSTNPATPDEVIAEVTTLVPREINRIVAAAGAAVQEWAADAPRRSRALHAWAERVTAHAEELVDLVAREVGKPVGEARAEIARSEAILRYYAQAVYDPIAEILPGSNARTHVTVRRHPIGVVAAICPWNFPLAIPAWKLGPALAYGNTALFKPASSAVATGRRLVELSRPEVPDDVLAFVPIPGAAVGDLMDDPRIDGVSFTGSAAIGRELIARVAGRGGTIQAEMGGQNASIVLADADLDDAAATITNAAMAYAGQKCTATSRIIVERAVAKPLVQRLTDLVGALKVGDPLDPNTDVGPLIDEEARRGVAKAVEAARARGASLLVGATSADRDGWFYSPTLLAVDNPRDPFVVEETFGPAAAVMIVDSAEQAVTVTNGTAYGLSAAVFGADPEATAAVAEAIRAGMVRVNGATTGADFWAPFGGDRASSYGPREQGRAAREFFTRTRTVTVVRQ